ncbi:MAG: glycine cleavage system protein T [Halobacteriovoraceae bacterium]|nr:glycine cleavage system protein T [Halobacteriovoraceae bacterium]|tara:strand:+ start:9489 stop:10565 length:1077 start_codon:yes stop_codon:yes gene_type:complete
MSNQTALYNQHLNLGAKMVDFAGWQMPIQYKNLKEEVKAIRESVGVFDVSHMGEFFIRGNDALKFVDYMVTNDIAGAQIGKAIYSPLCREDGTIIDDLIVYKLANDEILICVNASNIEKDFQWFEKHVQDFDCQLKNESDEYSLLALQGPKSFEVLSKCDLGFQVNDIEYYSIQAHDANGSKTLIARTGYTGEDGFEIFGPHDLIKNLWNQLMELNVMPCGLGARDVLRLEVCYPLYGHELTDEITPLDCGLKWTVKLKKENFIGKTFLESYQPKYQLLKLVLDKGIPRDHYVVEDENGNQLGEVTSGTMSVILGKGIALARVEKKLYSEDMKINVDIRGRKYMAQVTKKPFVVGGHK